MTCGSSSCREHIKNSLTEVSQLPVLDCGTTFHSHYGGQDWPSTPSDNLWNLTYLATETFSDSTEFMGAIQTNLSIYKSSWKLQVKQFADLYWTGTAVKTWYRVQYRCLPSADCHAIASAWLSAPSYNSIYGLQTSGQINLTKGPILPSVLWHCWLGARKSIQPVKIKWCGVGVVICLERGADCLHMVQLMPLPSPNPIVTCLI